MTYVVDASLAVKWLVQEDDSDKADRFLIDTFGLLHAPDLLLIEIGSTLVRRANQQLTDGATALAGLARLIRWSEQAFTLHRVSPLLTRQAARMAISRGHPIKDCIYLALADELGIPLATSDIKFRDKVADPKRVRLLAELA